MLQWLSLLHHTKKDSGFEFSAQRAPFCVDILGAAPYATKSTVTNCQLIVEYTFFL